MSVCLYTVIQLYSYTVIHLHLYSYTVTVIQLYSYKVHPDLELEEGGQNETDTFLYS